MKLHECCPLRSWLARLPSSICATVSCEESWGVREESDEFSGEDVDIISPAYGVAWLLSAEMPSTGQ